MQSEGSWRSWPSLSFGLLALGLALGSPLRAAPAPADTDADADPSKTAARDALWVLPPDSEGPARDLLAPVVERTPASSSWRGPQIEIDRIKWWLMRGDEACGILVLLPRKYADAGAPRSKSFAIQVTWAPKLDPSAAERELMAAAVDSVHARDQGGFYNVAADNLVFGGDDYEQDELPPPYARSSAQLSADPAASRRRWGLELGGVALLGLFALAINLRKQTLPS